MWRKTKRNKQVRSKMLNLGVQVMIGLIIIGSKSVDTEVILL